MIDVRLFAHITLDPELGGRYDVEGNHFETTFGYLNQYIEVYFKEQKQAVPESLQKMCQAMTSLLQFEKAIQISNSDDSTAIELDWWFLKVLTPLIPKSGQVKELERPEGKLEQLNTTIVQAIERLQIGEDLLIPGGWSNNSSPGHAMIYQFTRTKEGLQFSIYNSGAGIRFHEKTKVL